MNTRKSPENLSEHLVENGLEFLERAVQNMGDSAGITELKFAAVDLSIAIEVLLKARLMREHWTLICADANKAKPQDFVAGSVATVTPDQLLTRLEAIAGMSSIPRRSAELKELMRVRNRAVHFTLAGENTLGLRTSLARGLDFLVWLLDTELRSGGTAAETQLVDGNIELLAERLGQIAALVAQRMTSIHGELRSALAVVECPRCGQPALILGDGEAARCAFCLWNPGGEECANEYVTAVQGVSSYEVIKDGGEWPVYFCLDCGQEALVRDVIVLEGAASTSDGSGSRWWGCLACGVLNRDDEIDFCTRCESLMTADDESLICSDCMHSLLVDD